MSEPERVPLWTRPERRVSFTPWSSGAPVEEAPPSLPLPATIDPEAIRGEAYAAGLADGRRTVEAEIAAERYAVARLAEALDSLKPEPPHALGLLLADTVKRLVRQIVGEVTIDGDALLERAQAAAAIIAEETAPARMRLHPSDLERLRDALLDIDLVPDSHLASGTIVVETGEGWIEDGPEVRLEKLRLALDGMGVPR